MQKIKLLIIVTFITILCWSCGSSSSNNSENDETTEENEKADPDNPMAAMQQAMKEMEKVVDESGMKNVEPIDFRKLKDLLPDEVAGLERTKAEGEKSGAMGIKISKAEGRYEAEGKRVKITITDMGFMSAGGLGGFMSAGWLMAEIDRESDTEYEKTTTYDGYKAYEKYNSSRNEGELSLMVGERFMVQVEGDDISMDEIKEAVDSIDLSELDDMKDEGVK